MDPLLVINKYVVIPFCVGFQVTNHNQKWVWSKQINSQSYWNLSPEHTFHISCTVNSQNLKPQWKTLLTEFVFQLGMIWQIWTPHNFMRGFWSGHHKNNLTVLPTFFSNVFFSLPNIQGFFTCWKIEVVQERSPPINPQVERSPAYKPHYIPWNVFNLPNKTNSWECSSIQDIKPDFIG